MLPDRVSNTGPPTYESGALPIALRDLAKVFIELLWYSTCDEQNRPSCIWHQAKTILAMSNKVKTIAVCLHNTSSSGQLG